MDSQHYPYISVESSANSFILSTTTNSGDRWLKTIRHDKTNLIYFIPFGIQAVLDDLALEKLIANLNDPIWIRLSFDQTTQISVFSQQILGF